MFDTGALWDAIRRLQRDLKCKQRCLGISSSGDATLVLNQQGDWIVNGTGAGLTFDNGLTLKGSNVHLGGDLLDFTVISFNPNSLEFGFGDLDGNRVLYGNINSDGKANFQVIGDNTLFINTEQVTFTAQQINSVAGKVIANAVDGSNTNYKYYVDAIGVIPSVAAEIEETSDPSENPIYGLYIYNDGGIKRSNIYYGIKDALTQEVKDVSRVEANSIAAHGRISTSAPNIPIANTTYNGWHASSTFVQLEYNKTAEDEQDTGTCFTLNNLGATLFVDGNPFFRIEPDGDTVLWGRLQQKKGNNIASASTITLGDDGNVFIITGTTTIQLIDSTNWQAGSIIILIFQSAATVKNGAGSSGVNKQILLNGSTDLIGAANNVLQLVFDGTQWQEVSRKQP